MWLDDDVSETPVANSSNSLEATTQNVVTEDSGAPTQSKSPPGSGNPSAGPHTRQNSASHDTSGTKTPPPDARSGGPRAPATDTKLPKNGIASNDELSENPSGVRRTSSSGHPQPVPPAEPKKRNAREPAESKPEALQSKRVVESPKGGKVVGRKLPAGNSGAPSQNGIAAEPPKSWLDQPQRKGDAPKHGADEPPTKADSPRGNKRTNNRTPTMKSPPEEPLQHPAAAPGKAESPLKSQTHKRGGNQPNSEAGRQHRANSREKRDHSQGNDSPPKENKNSPEVLLQMKRVTSIPAVPEHQATLEFKGSRQERSKKKPKHADGFWPDEAQDPLGELKRRPSAMVPTLPPVGGSPQTQRLSSNTTPQQKVHVDMTPPSRKMPPIALETKERVSATKPQHRLAPLTPEAKRDLFGPQSARAPAPSNFSPHDQYRAHSGKRIDDSDDIVLEFDRMIRNRRAIEKLRLLEHERKQKLLEEQQAMETAKREEDERKAREEEKRIRAEKIALRKQQHIKLEEQRAQRLAALKVDEQVFKHDYLEVVTKRKERAESEEKKHIQEVLKHRHEAVQATTGDHFYAELNNHEERIRLRMEEFERKLAALKRSEKEHHEESEAKEPRTRAQRRVLKQIKREKQRLMEHREKIRARLANRFKYGAELRHHHHHSRPLESPHANDPRQAELESRVAVLRKAAVEMQKKEAQLQSLESNIERKGGALDKKSTDLLQRETAMSKRRSSIEELESDFEALRLEIARADEGKQRQKSSERASSQPRQVTSPKKPSKPREGHRAPRDPEADSVTPPRGSTRQPTPSPVKAAQESSASGNENFRARKKRVEEFPPMDL